MSLRHIVFGSGVSTAPLIVSDVFATVPYAGNSSTQTINNGVDLAGKGGMIWIKSRDSANVHNVWDSARGLSAFLETDSTSAQITQGSTSFNSNGFTFGTGGSLNNVGGLQYVSWTFRKAPKFFDVVNWSGNNVVGRRISHGLGVKPGLIIVKCTNATGNWFAVARDDSSTQWRFLLNSTAYTNGGNTDPSGYWTTTDFSLAGVAVGSGESATLVNASGNSYIAYLFAHDTSADGMIRCGSFTTDGIGNASINLGYRPQFVLFRLLSVNSNWVITDSARGMPTGTGDKVLVANLTDSETTTSLIDTSSTGFSLTGLGSNVTGIYMAIKSAV